MKGVKERSSTGTKLCAQHGMKQCRARYMYDRYQVKIAGFLLQCYTNSSIRTYTHPITRHCLLPCRRIGATTAEHCVHATKHAKVVSGIIIFFICARGVVLSAMQMKTILPLALGLRLSH